MTDQQTYPYLTIGQQFGRKVNHLALVEQPLPATVKIGGSELPLSQTTSGIAFDGLCGAQFFSHGGRLRPDEVSSGWVDKYVHKKCVELARERGLLPAAVADQDIALQRGEIVSSPGAVAPAPDIAPVLRQMVDLFGMLVWHMKELRGGEAREELDRELDLLRERFARYNTEAYRG